MADLEAWGRARGFYTAVRSLDPMNADDIKTARGLRWFWQEEKDGRRVGTSLVTPQQVGELIERREGATLPGVMV